MAQELSDNIKYSVNAMLAGRENQKGLTAALAMAQSVTEPLMNDSNGFSTLCSELRDLLDPRDASSLRDEEEKEARLKVIRDAHTLIESLRKTVDPEYAKWVRTTNESSSQAKIKSDLDVGHEQDTSSRTKGSQDIPGLKHIAVPAQAEQVRVSSALSDAAAAKSDALWSNWLRTGDELKLAKKTIQDLRTSLSHVTLELEKRNRDPSKSKSEPTVGPIDMDTSLIEESELDEGGVAADAEAHQWN